MSERTCRLLQLFAIPRRIYPIHAESTQFSWIAVACQKNGVEVFMLGGRLSPSGGIDVGDVARPATTSTHADIAVLGVCGIDPEFGLSADGFHESQLKLAMSRAAGRTIAVASREKINRRARYQSVTPASLNCLITDADAGAVEGFDNETMEIIHA